MQHSDILTRLKLNGKLAELLKTRLNPRLNIEKNLDIAFKYYVEHKSTTKIAQEYQISASRISDILELYRTKIAPLLVKIVNGEVITDES